ncbi:MAG: nucleotidyltransferase domain-containing protein [Pyrinomonadaceae bacterium]
MEERLQKIIAAAGIASRRHAEEMNTRLCERQHMVEMNQILALSNSIAQEFQPERIILFGSYAAGNPRADSDVDLLIVMSFEEKPIRKALEILHKIEPRIPVDLLVRTPEQVKERIDTNDWFMRDVLEKGRVLYEADRARVGG